MSNYDDRDTAITRDPVQGQPYQQQYQQYQPLPPQQYYGYGRGAGGMRRPGGWSETKPFFMTSEFLFTLLTVIATAIVAAVAEDLDSHRAMPLIAGLVAAYTISRGIAKAGTRSRATDPRDDVDLHRSQDGDRS